MVCKVFSNSKKRRKKRVNNDFEGNYCIKNPKDVYAIEFDECVFVKNK